ncbi:hypothetical protein [Bacillus piscicola]|uniref:hypothetical protein n=1 Tax=Bacillus piscicola TaxID=1632684 RepID=UPI001F091D5C|nr:hypothetical protein [Bacillus piscicola]
MHVHRKTGALLQRVLWHIRWGLLLILMLISIVFLSSDWGMNPFLGIQAAGWALYFFLGQWESYFECQSNCKL